MAERTLYDKIWQSHTVGILPTGQTQLFIGLHLIHEITTAPAFDMLREKGMDVAFRDRTFATVDHIVPTDIRQRPFLDQEAEELTQALEKNVKQFGVEFFGLDSMNQGIVHVIGPQLGLTQPGMTLACGDSHTSTHGAFGTLAFGIGTSQVRDVLGDADAGDGQIESAPHQRQRRSRHRRLCQGRDPAYHPPTGRRRRQGIRLRVRRRGDRPDEHGRAHDRVQHEHRRRRAGRLRQSGPDDIRLSQRPAPCAQGRGVRQGGQLLEVGGLGRRCRSIDDVVNYDGKDIEPTVTWGINPGQSVGVSEKLPLPEQVRAIPRARKKLTSIWAGRPGAPIIGTPVNVAFIGSCTNGRLADFRAAAKIAKGRKVNPNVRALVVPGSAEVKKLAEAEGLDKIFEEAGFQWREAGCSMCLAMNPDKLNGREISASSSNRNFIGRQGSPQGRTLLMSPAMVVAAALNGKVVDVRQYE